MTDMERKTFCEVLRCYGGQAQITMVFEEMAELQDVLCKFLRGREACAMYSNNGGICNNGALPLRRPPQSWCYVEVC